MSLFKKSWKLTTFKLKLFKMTKIQHFNLKLTEKPEKHNTTYLTLSDPIDYLTEMSLHL